MRKCRTCGKKTKNNFCKTCTEFHKHKYSKKELAQILEEYERLNQ